MIEAGSQVAQRATYRIAGKFGGLVIDNGVAKFNFRQINFRQDFVMTSHRLNMSNYEEVALYRYFSREKPYL